MASKIKPICNHMGIKYETVCTYASRHNITINEALCYYVYKYKDKQSKNSERLYKKLCEKIPKVILERELLNPITNKTKTIKDWIISKNKMSILVNRYIDYIDKYKDTDDVSDLNYLDKLFSILLFTSIKILEHINFLINASILLKNELDYDFNVVTDKLFPNGTTERNAFIRYTKYDIPLRDCVIESPHKYRRGEALNALVTIDNVTKPAYEWCKILNVPTNIYVARTYNTNRTYKEALLFESKYNTNINRYKYNREITYDNISLSLTEWCSVFKITETAFVSYQTRTNKTDEQVVEYYMNRHNCTI